MRVTEPLRLGDLVALEKPLGVLEPVAQRDTVGDLDIVPRFDVAKGERVDEMQGDVLLLRVPDGVSLKH